MNANPTKAFGIHARPKQSEITDVSVDLSFRQADPVFCFFQHLKDFRDRLTIRFANTVQVFDSDESKKQVTDVVNQLDFRDTQLRVEYAFT